MIERNIIYGINRTDRLKSINYKRIPFQSQSTGTTLFPDNVAPQNTYGDQVMFYEYTPVSDNSILIITPIISVESSTGTNSVTSAVFFDDEIYSKGGMPTYLEFGSGGDFINYNVGVTNNSRTPIDIKVRAGGRNASTTITFNKYLAGDTASSLTIEEFQVLN